VVAKEMINEGDLKTIESMPLKVVQVMAIAMHATEAKKLGTPLFIRIAITQADNPIIAPTEISKFPDMIRIVAPAATKPKTEICSNIFMRLLILTNFGLIIVVIVEIRMITNRSKNH
jgi:hypothetical protein